MNHEVEHGVDGAIEMVSTMRTGRRTRVSGLTVLVAFFVATVALGASGLSAQAGKGWCRVDPIVSIDNQIADIFIGSNLSALTSTTGPIKIVVTVPTGTKTAHIISDLGFGRGYDLTFVKSSNLVKTDDRVPVHIDVYVPAKKDSLPISVYFAPHLLTILSPLSADGSANQWLRLGAHV
jgi:hypothetical protein